MTEEKLRKIVTARGGVINDLTLHIKLILRLMGDPRVSLFLKVLPVGSLIYLIFPDLVPGPLDDAFVIWLGSYLFVELCPPQVVQEHMTALKQVVPGQWRDAQPSDNEIIDADYWEEKP
jgi:hypothetical protein